MANETPADEATHRLMITGDGTVRYVPLHGRTRWLVGRGNGCNIELRSQTVSRQQLEIVFRDQQWFFKNLSSSNPVRLAGEQVQHGALAENQTLAIGLTQLTLQRRKPPAPLRDTGGNTLVVRREVAEEPPSRLPVPMPALNDAAIVLEQMASTFADFGALSDAADPLLEVAMSLTGRRRGWIGRALPDGRLEQLAGDPGGEVPIRLLTEATRFADPQLLGTEESGGERQRLVIPLGPAQQGVLVLEDPAPEALGGQELLRLARSLGTVVWQRLCETTERIHSRTEMQRLRFHGTVAHKALLTSRRLSEARQAALGLGGSSLPVLILGEEGTEREDLARYLHTEGPRRSHPFVACNAQRLVGGDQLVTLFADAGDRTGLWQQAAGGTLLIDYGEALAPTVQQRLLEVIAAPVDDEAPPPLLVLSSNAAVDGTDARWSPELAERLRGQILVIPPLRADSRDVLTLAELFLAELRAGPDDRPHALSSRAQMLLGNYHWPGNVHELKVVLEAAAVRAGKQVIQPRHLPAHIGEEAGNGSAPTDLPTLDEIERRYILDVMQRTGGNRSRAASILGIASSTLYEKLKRFKIDL
jgi:transcriptional regulator with AAA-type ATPase domain